MCLGTVFWGNRPLYHHLLVFCLGGGPGLSLGHSFLGTRCLPWSFTYYSHLTLIKLFFRNSNVIVKNQTVYEEQNSRTTTIATACISTLLTLIIVAGIMIFYHRRNPYEPFTNSTELRTIY